MKLMIEYKNICRVSIVNLMESSQTFMMQAKLFHPKKETLLILLIFDDNKSWADISGYLIDSEIVSLNGTEIESKPKCDLTYDFFYARESVCKTRFSEILQEIFPLRHWQSWSILRVFLRRNWKRSWSRKSGERVVQIKTEATTVGREFCNSSMRLEKSF